MIIPNAASEGIAIQHGTGIYADYECRCPICGEESGVDDLGAEYECQECHNLVIFREANIKMAEPEDESIKAISQKEHETIHRGKERLEADQCSCDPTKLVRGESK